MFSDKLLRSRTLTQHGGHSIVARGLYALQLVPWLEQFAGDGQAESRIMVLTIGQLKGNSSSSSGSNSSGSSSCNDSSNSDSSNSDSSNNDSSNNDINGGVQHTMNAVFRFVGIPPHDLANVEPRNTRAYSTLSAQTRARLAAFYAPFNQRLLALLAQYPSTRHTGPEGTTLDW